MSVTSQQVTKTAAAKQAPSRSGLMVHVRGLAGNHTLMRKQGEKEIPENQTEKTAEYLSAMGDLPLQRKCACGGGSSDCKECKKPEKVLLQRSVSNSCVQPKLAVSSPGDVYEQEADQLAEKVMRMPDQPVQRVSSGSRGLPSMQTPKPRLAQPRFQTKHVGTTAGWSAAPPMVHDVLRSPGQPLSSATRAFMEQRFEHDFSRVRVHTDPRAAESARQVGAVAYTVGHHMVFDSARYAPQTNSGRRLLAHELGHTIQQGAASRHTHAGGIPGVTATGPGVAPMVQRALGFEFQTSNIMTTSKNQLFGSKDHKFFHKGKSGVELQSDTGSVVEFETKPSSKWSEVEAQVQEAVDICRALNDTFLGESNFAWNEAHRLEQKFAFSEEGRVAREKPLARGEKLVVKIVWPKFEAKIQSTEGLSITEFESFVKEHEKTELIDPVINSARNILDVATKANPKIKPGTTENLQGFLILIVDYLLRGQRVGVPIGKGSTWAPTKAIFGLMSRTDFASIYQSILTPDERELFVQIVNSSVIPNELGIKADDPLFANGYWGHHLNMMALFKGGKIIALANKDNHSDPIHDCSSKTKTSGLKIGECGKTVSATNIIIGSWLKSIITNKKDLLSPPAGGSVSMGKRAVKENRPDEKGLILVEARGTRRNAGQGVGLVLNDWLPYVEEVFKFAAFCRKKSGLVYDGDDRFGWNRCVPPK